MKRWIDLYMVQRNHKQELKFDLIKEFFNNSDL